MEKPFSCPVANCSLSFANEDHLVVHKKKHELSLSLTPTPKSPFIVDQTPTPTRFLNALDLEFQDFANDNPFDATFRRANSTNASNNLVIPESSSLISSLPDTSEVLNTPSITLPSEPATPITLKPIAKKFIKNYENKVTVESSNSLEEAPVEQILSKEKAVTENLQSRNAENGVLPSVSSSFTVQSDENLHTQRESIVKSVSQTSVITSVGNSTILKTNGTVGVPTAVVVSRSPVNNTLTTTPVSVITQPQNQVKMQETLQPICVAPVVQLMIRLPDGQTVQLPIVTSTTSNKPTRTVTPIAPQVTSTTSNAKMKLKEVLTFSKKVDNSIIKKNNQRLKSKPNIHVISNSNDTIVINSSPPTSPLQSSQRPVHTGRRRRDFIDDPDEKRKRSLERNRAAATRCREKRKLWITDLERKANELARTNAQLQKEVTQLRNEVSHLKAMLLAHKDCPVTLLQQRVSNYDTEPESYSTINISLSSSEDVQQVPTSSNVSPLNSDFMEIEISSVQSSSDASLTSDASEASYRER